MKTKFNGILTLLLAFVVQISFAQTTVSGTVSEENGPLPGANVIIKGTNTGTQTDFDGNYSIQASPTDVLVFSFVGFASQEIVVSTQTSINVTLASDNALDEVIVTAQGIKREKKALGYAVTTVSAEQVEQKPQTDLVRALNGKIAGVDITGAGGATGSATNIRVRTSVSLNGNNQPLYIVDGVPFESGANQVGGFGDGSTNTSSRTLDLNPDNIETISVLKGFSAANLYGSQGRNGVILITTKAGSSGGKDANKKFEISVTNTSYITEIANLPDYQNTYGQGADQTFNPGFVGNWGAAFSDLDTVIHPYANGRNPGFEDLFPEFFGIEIPYEAQPDNVSDFFRSGLGRTTSIGASSSFDKGNISFNFANTTEDGYIQENSLRRDNFSVGGNLNLTNKFTLGGTLNYVNNNLTTPPISAGNAAGAISIFERLLYIPRNLDLTNLPFSNPVTGASVYYRPDLENPYWLLENSANRSDTRRTFGSFRAGYEFNDHINFLYTYGFDTYSDEQTFHVNRGGVATTEYQIGYLRTTRSTNQITNHRAVLNFSDYKFGNDNFTFNAILGGEARSDDFSRDGIASTDQIVFGRVNHDNFINHSNLDPITGVDLQFDQKQNIVGLFTELQLDYKNYLFATLSGRNDWVSNVQVDNRSLFYPSASLSFIPTAAIEGLKSNAINYLKVRANFAQSAGFPDGFPTVQTLNSNGNAFQGNNGPVTTNTLSLAQANPDLRPELHTEYEVGLEARLFNNRVTLDASVYTRKSEDQILTQNLPPSTGFTSRQFNAGRIDGEGIEIGLTIDAIKNDNFQWSITNNFTAAETEVVSIPEEEIVIAGFNNLGNAAIEGQPLGVIIGSYFIRDDAGNILVDATNGTTQGRYLTSNDVAGVDPTQVIGDPNPDWKLTTINSFTYKNITLSGQLEYTHGGDIYSLTNQLLLLRGVTRDTEDRESTTILPGVVGNPATGQPVLDANGQPIQNNVQIGANDIFFQDVFRAAEGSIWDASTIRLREVSIGYKLPEKFLEKTPLGSLNFTLSGQNIWYKAVNVPEYTNFDPEVLSTGVGNGQGLDFLTAPTTKRFAISVKATF